MDGLHMHVLATSQHEHDMAGFIMYGTAHATLLATCGLESLPTVLNVLSSTTRAWATQHLAVTHSTSIRHALLMQL